MSNQGFVMGFLRRSEVGGGLTSDIESLLEHF